MNKLTKISALIITFNEEHNIERCIKSLAGIADEIVVIDSYSTDKTSEICTNYDVKFIQNKFEGHIEQKNFAISKASYDFVLSLDADEEVSAELKESILDIKSNTSQRAYSFNRLTSYCGKWIKHCGWYPDVKIRLWDKSCGQWGGINPHDTVILNTGITAQHINGDLKHYSYHTIEEHIKQINFFSTIAAEEAFKEGKSANLLTTLFKTKFKFLRDYFFKLGFLDGYYGFVICFTSSFATYLKYTKLRELVKNK